ncbi:NRT1-PTR FAMILY 2-12 protein [Nymphaea thermarum]|nr:NRT1-PTR FAMILY 2-12 protein [Nymphaea thermarum]
MERENIQENAYEDLEGEGCSQTLRFPDSGSETGRSSSRKGGWITAPFLIGSASAATVALFGVTTDLLVYGTLALTLTAVLPSLAPPPCGQVSSWCEPSAAQFAILCCVYALVALGAAGTSYIYIALGADQFDKAKDQEAFVNWYLFATTLATLISYTVVVYILDNVGWVWGYGLCMVLNGIGLVMILLGRARYRDVRPQGSPFVSMARVIVGASRKIKVSPSMKEDDYYSGGVRDGAGALPKNPPLTSSFRFLNRAALVTKGDVDEDGKLAKPWRLCTMQQVEDLKKLLKLLPLWSTGIYLMVSFGVQVTLTTLQVLAMDRSLGPHFKIPAASFQVFPFLSMTILLPIVDRFFYPLLDRIPRVSPSLLHRIGAGHVVAIASFVSMAVAEGSRLNMMHSRGVRTEQTSALILVPALLLNGIASAFFIPGQLSLYYQEFPESLKATSTAMMSLTTGVGFYLGAPVLGAIRRVTGWLPDDVNQGRLDNVYWTLAVLGLLNFLYYLVCAKAYRLKA